MITSEVKTDLCFTGFGNPSDEVTMNFFIHISLFLHGVDREDYEFRKRPILRRFVHYVWPIFGSLYLFAHMFGLVALGANSFNQVLFGASIGFTMAMILHFWVKPMFINLQSNLTKKQMAENYQGDEVFEDRYILKFRHVMLVLLSTVIMPLFLAGIVLDSYDNTIDDDFKNEVILQKMWLGNECPIDLNDASEILQYKHFVCECTIIGLFGVWIGQFFEWQFLSNRGIINQSPWLWH